MLRSALCIFLFLVGSAAYSKNILPPLPKDTVATGPYHFRDSASLARWNARNDSVRAVKDSLQQLSDSLSIQWTKTPDAGRPNLFLDSLVKINTVVNFDFASQLKRFPVKYNRFDKGKLRPVGEAWVPGFICLLLIFFAILRRVYAKDMVIIFQSFLSNRVLNQISREANLFSSWPFVLLYILFGFTIGTLLYLSGKYFQLTYTFGGFQWLTILSLSVIGLFTLKILLIRVVGFLFDVKKLAGEYISILSLSYFNAAILYLPLIIAFSLTPGKFAQLYIYIAIALLAIVFFFQFLRAGVNILSSTRFPRTYLIIYLCALEVCPLLILIKALRF